MPAPNWVADYIGLPYLQHGRTREGMDCWGLIILVFAEKFKVTLPSYATDYRDVDALEEINDIVEVEKQRGWVQIPAGSERLGDVVVFRVVGIPCHVGMVTEQGRFLHTIKGIDSAHADYTSSRWRNRVNSFWRYLPER